MERSSYAGRADIVTTWSLAAAFWLVLAAQAGPDEACLACHSDAQMRSEDGRSLFVDPGRHGSSVHGGLGCASCHSDIEEFPHPDRVVRPQCADCHTEAPAEVSGSVHESLGAESCSMCHGSAHEVQPASGAAPGQCAACHSEPVEQYRSSVHADMANGGPTCFACHGPAHRIAPGAEPSSPVARRNLPQTCGSCHADPDFLARHGIPFAKPVEAFRLSVHGRALEEGNEAAASCSDCHGSHAILPGRDSRAAINRWNVPETCGACHTEIRESYENSIHGQAVRRGAGGSPVCTDCHGEHAILAPNEPQSLVNPVRVSAVTCGRCHSDERLSQRYNLPTDRVPSFEDSYHGLALRAGSQTVANCASCHGVHDILPSSDPSSTIHPANLASTCGRCHPGAGSRFAIGPVHVRPASASEHPVVRWIRWIYLVLIPVTLGFMLLHNLLDFLAKLIRGVWRPASRETLPRMNRNFRLAHGLLLLSFPALVITGFALKFPEQWWAAPLLQWENQFALRGSIHRVAGVVLVGALVYHFAHLLFVPRDRGILRGMWLRLRDLRDLRGVLAHNLGLITGRPPERLPQRPQFGKFSYAEKIEYWAFLWGTVVMALSGFLLWFNNFTLQQFPAWVPGAATAVHYYEAILATLAIAVWHFYMVIFDPDVYPMDLAWLTGRTSADHLRHTRPAYYARLLEEQATHPEISEETPDQNPPLPTPTKEDPPAKEEPPP